MADEKEKKAFLELKRRMEGDMEKELYEDDNMFHRFLRARDLKVDAAEAMLREHLKWREKYDVKNILEYKPPEVLEKYFPATFLGFTKEGEVIRFIPSGTVDSRGVMASCTTEEWAKHLIKNFEEDLLELKKQSKKLGRLVDKVVYIHNLKGMTLAKTTDRKVVFQLFTFTAMYQDNYPESLKSIYCINSPTYFSLIYTALKTFLPSHVIKKIHVYTDESWRKDLLDVIDAEVLPAFLGGTRTDPDGNPLCTTFINHGGLVPEKYKKREKESFTSSPDHQSITVPRSAVHEIPLEVKEPGSQLNWAIDIKSGDIKFGIKYQNIIGRRSDVVQLQKISTDEYIEIGSHKCENSGTHIIVFDNSYSLMKSKDVSYRLQILPPENELCLEDD